MLDNRIPNFIQNHTLVVADPASIYRSGPKTSFISAIQKIHSKTSTAKQIVVIGSPAPTRYRTKLVEYEKSVGKAFNEPIEAICCYNASHQKRLLVPDIISRCLLPITIQFTASNGITAHGLKREIINIIKDGIDSASGAGSSRLVLRTCSLVYDLSTAEKILKQPEQFEATLNKILGKKHPKKQSNQLWTDSRMKCCLSIERPRFVDKEALIARLNH
jgi:hypothetical protein